MKASFVSVLSVAAAVSAASNDTLITSTILQTQVYTVTSCAPTVTNCPVGKVTSEIITTTTICPATATFVPAPPAVTPPSGPSTQTFYNTQVYTITSCAPTVTNCPVGKVTSSVITSTAVVSKPATSAVAPPVSTGPAAGVPSSPASASGNSGKPSSVVYSLPGGASSCAPAITSYITVTAGASSVPAVPATAGSNSGASVPAGCGGVGSPACPVATSVSTPSKSTTPVYGTAAPSGSVVKPSNGTVVPFTGGAATQKTAGLLMAVGLAAALL